MGRQKDKDHTKQHQQIVMVVVRGFLHQVNRCPHNSESKHTQPVFEAKHHKNPKNPHYAIIPKHPVSGQRLEKFKTYKIKSELWLNKGTRNPTRPDRAPGFNGDKQTKKHSENMAAPTASTLVL